MKIIIKRNRKLLLVVLALILLMSLSLTGCGEETETETDTETETETENQLQIRRLKGIHLESKLPCNVVMYEDASDAYENAMNIKQPKEGGTILLSCMSSSYFVLSWIKKGMIVEENRECKSDFNIESVGDIRTVELMLPKLEESATVVYELYNERYTGTNRFIAFYITPMP